MNTKEKILAIVILLLVIFGKAYDNNIQSKARYQATVQAETEAQERYDIIHSDIEY